MANSSNLVFATFNETDHAEYAFEMFADAYNPFARTDDEIEVYVEDDDAPYNLYGVPTGGVVFLVIVASAILGGCVFYCSYIQERKGSRCCPRSTPGLTQKDDDEDEQPLRSTQDIESKLKLKQWDSVCDEDEVTHANSSSDDEEAQNEVDEDRSLVSVSDDENGSVAGNSISTVSKTDSHTSDETDKTSHSESIVVSDTDFSELQRRPRCVLCSKFFKDTDVVTESWDPSCDHHFHKDCMVRWLQWKEGCPVCKKDYVVGVVVTSSDVFRNE